jgi:hypoxanthine phosphoribosyltransferase
VLLVDDIVDTGHTLGYASDKCIAYSGRMLSRS